MKPFYESTHWTHSNVVNGVPTVCSLDVVRFCKVAGGRRGTPSAFARWGSHVKGWWMALWRRVWRWRPRFGLVRPAGALNGAQRGSVPPRG